MFSVSVFESVVHLKTKCFLTHLCIFIYMLCNHNIKILHVSICMMGMFLLSTKLGQICNKFMPQDS